MRLNSLITLCQAYRNLGDAVGDDQLDQLDDLVEDGEPRDQNPNALKLIKSRFLEAVLDETNPDEDDELREEINDLIDEIRDWEGPKLERLRRGADQVARDLHVGRDDE